MEILGRVALVYVILTFAFRSLGKRELSQMSPFELVMLLMIAEVVSPALTAGDDSLVGALIGMTTLLCVAFAHSVLSYHSKWFRSAAESPPAMVVAHGRIIEPALHNERIRPDEICSEMHKAGIETLAQVRWAFLEPDGTLSFIRADDAETGGSGREAAVA